MYNSKSSLKVAYLLIVGGIAMVVYSAFLTNAEASEAGRSATRLSPTWTQRDANGNAQYQECGQECTYQKANENLVIQSRYIQEKNAAKFGEREGPISEGEEAYHRLLLLKIGSAIGQNSNQTAALRSLKPDSEEARDVARIAQEKNVNAPALKPLLPTVYQSKDIALEIQNKLADPEFARQLMGNSKTMTLKEFDEAFRPREGDFLTFKQVAREVGNPQSDKIWTTVRATGFEYLRAKTDYESNLKQKAFEYLSKLQGEIRTKYKTLKLPKDRPPTLEDYLSVKQDANHYHEVRERIAVAANADIKQRYPDAIRMPGPGPRAPAASVYGPNGLIPTNGLTSKGNVRRETPIYEENPSSEKVNHVYLTDKMDHFNAENYEAFSKTFMRRQEDSDDLKKQLEVGGSR